MSEKNYEARMRERAEALRARGHAVILAVESSCDETAVAVVEDGRVERANAIASQIDVHALYGGVVPEIASRMHVEAIDPLLDRALEEAGLTLDQIDAVAVTHGPGLVGALLTGVSWAKALAYARDLPVIPVNHIEGHVSANYVAHPNLEPPFVCLVASGGHSHIVSVEHYGGYRLLGQTTDDAAGEAFDKVARVLDIPYPGGPLLDKRLSLSPAPHRGKVRLLLQRPKDRRHQSGPQPAPAGAGDPRGGLCRVLSQERGGPAGGQDPRRRPGRGREARGRGRRRGGKLAPASRIGAPGPQGGAGGIHAAQAAVHRQRRDDRLCGLLRSDGGGTGPARPQRSARAAHVRRLNGAKNTEFHIIFLQ